VVRVMVTLYCAPELDDDDPEDELELEPETPPEEDELLDEELEELEPAPLPDEFDELDPETGSELLEPLLQPANSSASAAPAHHKVFIVPSERSNAVPGLTPGVCTRL
jgi:hypothetical protein